MTVGRKKVFRLRGCQLTRIRRTTDKKSTWTVQLCHNFPPPAPSPSHHFFSQILGPAFKTTDNIIHVNNSWPAESPACHAAQPSSLDPRSFPLPRCAPSSPPLPPTLPRFWLPPGCVKPRILRRRCPSPRIGHLRLVSVRTRRKVLGPEEPSHSKNDDPSLLLSQDAPCSVSYRVHCTYVRTI